MGINFNIDFYIGISLFSTNFNNLSYILIWLALLRFLFPIFMRIGDAALFCRVLLRYCGKYSRECAEFFACNRNGVSLFEERLRHL